MKKYRWHITIGSTLILSSTLIYFLHYLIFNKPKHMFTFLVEDIAFVPIEVLLVSIIIHKLLADREKKHILQKMNVVIGTFFSELGNKLIELGLIIDVNIDGLKKLLKIEMEWGNNEFKNAIKTAKEHVNDLSLDDISLVKLRDFLTDKRNYMIKLLENPVLLEHEIFTDLLQSVFHLEQELSVRDDIESMNNDDLTHIKGDIERVYKYLLKVWIEYMKHLKTDYPFLYSFAVRNNPFNCEKDCNIDWITK